MRDLVLWSFLLSLMPWALGLGRTLISGVAGLIGRTAPNRSVALPRRPACPGGLLRPVAARDRPIILMRSNDNLIAMSARSLPQPGRNSVLGSGSCLLPVEPELHQKDCR
jgi:hypothetical protein